MLEVDILPAGKVALPDEQEDVLDNSLTAAARLDDHG